MKLAIGLALVLFAVALIAWSLVRRPTAASGPDEAMAGLRKQALTLPPEQLGQESKAGQPFAVIMDIGYPNAVVSVVAFKTGDASIYISTGGGVIGGVGHAPVRAAAGALVRDLTDTMYNPAKPPYVSHEEGTRLVIAYIEKFWCPTMLSADLV